MISFMRAQGVQLTRCDGYSDYYDTYDGGNARGRSVEGVPWDGRQLGEWHQRINPGMARGIGLAVMTDEIRSLSTYYRSARSFRTTARVVLRTYWSRLSGKDLFTNGMSLIGQLTMMLLDRGVPIWLSTGVTEILIEGGRVVGVPGPLATPARAGSAVLVLLLSPVGLEFSGSSLGPHVHLLPERVRG